MAAQYRNTSIDRVRAAIANGSQKTEAARKERLAADRQVRAKLADKEKENAALRQELANMRALNPNGNGMNIDEANN